MDKARLTSNLLSSVSGVLLFLGLAFWIDLNGWSSLAPYLMATGILLLWFPGMFLKLLSPIGMLGKPFLVTTSHILIFLGLKVYLEDFITTQWFLYIVLGILLLNYHTYISEKLFPQG
jgi:hypothetical protein